MRHHYIWTNWEIDITSLWKISQFDQTYKLARMLKDRHEPVCSGNNKYIKGSFTHSILQCIFALKMHQSPILRFVEIFKWVITECDFALKTAHANASQLRFCCPTFTFWEWKWNKNSDASSRACTIKHYRFVMYGLHSKLVFFSVIVFVQAS